MMKRASSPFRPKAIKFAWIGLLVYFASYLMRINFAVMMAKIIEDMQVEKSALAIVVTCLTVTYGAGQVISGFLGDKISPRLMVIVGLALAGACNIALIFATAIPVMAVIWGINGFAHAMLWPPIVRMMSTYLTEEEYGYAAVRVSWGSSFATILLYLVAPLLLNVMHWRVVILLCAVGGLLIDLIWILVSKSLLTDPIRTSSADKNGATPKTAPLPRYVITPIILIMTGIMLQGILRDGVQNWMPSYLLESFGIPSEYAIMATVILGVFSIVSFSAFNLLHRKLFRNEVFCSAVIFAGSAVSALGLYFVNLYTEWVPVSMLAMAVIVSCMHGINLMLITVVPKRFAKSGRVSTFSGILNACTYVGAAIATYGFAVLEEAFGWNFTILMWFFISCAGLAVCLIATPIWKKFRRDYADNPNV